MNSTRRVIHKAKPTACATVVEARDCTNVDQLDNRTKYDVTYDDVFRLIAGSTGDKQFVKMLTGNYGGNSCWSADYGLTVIRGECSILQSERTVNENTDVKSVLIPRSKYCVVVEYKKYSDINRRHEESETFYCFTVTSGWKSVTVHI